MAAAAARTLPRWPLLLLLLLARLQQASSAWDTPSSQPATFAGRLGSLSVSFKEHSLASRPVMTGWNYTMPFTALRKGTGYTGSSHRLRRAMRDALNNQPIRVGFLGGSITHGSDASALGVTDWASLVTAWGQNVLPSATFRNGAVPATPSSYMAMCMEHSIDEDVDIVFIEYLVNDGSDNTVHRSGSTMGYERLMRRVLALPKSPAVIMLQTWGQAQAVSDETKWLPFYASHESAYSALAQYYDAQYLSFMSATNRLRQLGRPGYTYLHFMTDSQSNHPNDLGHRMLADLAVWLLQQTALDLILRPWGKADAQQLKERLPPPMVPGNEVPSSVMCLQGPSIQKVVTSSEGWQFVNEGTDKKPKTGYVSTTPGTTLKLTVDTVRSGQTGNVVVALGYLRSYQHMGKAAVRCESGCTCEAKELDGNNTEHSSQVFLGTLEVSQHSQCVISVTVLLETSSGEHKFKVSSMTISDVTDPERDPWFMDTSFHDQYFYANVRQEWRLNSDSQSGSLQMDVRPPST